MTNDDLPACGLCGGPAIQTGWLVSCFRGGCLSEIPVNDWRRLAVARAVERLPDELEAELIRVIWLRTGREYDTLGAALLGEAAQ